MKYALFAFVSTILILLAWILSPLLAAASVAAGVRRLPLGLQWFSTVDDDLDGGQHQNHYPAGVKGFRLVWQRMCWICRNPAQGFQAYLLGYSATGYYLVSDRDTPRGRYRVWAKNYHPHTLFAWQPAIKLTSKYYIKMWFGWALKSSINRFTFKFVPFSIGKIN